MLTKSTCEGWARVATTEAVEAVGVYLETAGLWLEASLQPRSSDTRHRHAGIYIHYTHVYIYSFSALFTFNRRRSYICSNIFGTREGNIHSDCNAVGLLTSFLRQPSGLENFAFKEASVNAAWWRKGRRTILLEFSAQNLSTVTSQS